MTKTPEHMKTPEGFNQSYLKMLNIIKEGKNSDPNDSLWEFLEGKVKSAKKDFDKGEISTGARELFQCYIKYNKNDTMG